MLKVLIFKLKQWYGQALEDYEENKMQKMWERDYDFYEEWNSSDCPLSNLSKGQEKEISKIIREARKRHKKEAIKKDKEDEKA